MQIYNNAQAMHEHHFGVNSTAEEPEGAGPRQVQGKLSFKVLAEIPISGLMHPPLFLLLESMLSHFIVTHSYPIWGVSNSSRCCRQLSPASVRVPSVDTSTAIATPAIFCHPFNITPGVAIGVLAPFLTLPGLRATCHQFRACQL